MCDPKAPNVLSKVSATDVEASSAVGSHIRAKSPILRTAASLPEISAVTQ
jgi:hypothetical protein